MLRWKIGDVTITQVVELETASIGRFVLPQATPDVLRAIPWLTPHFVNGEGEPLFSIQALIVDSQDRRIVVDTCLGNDKERTFREWNMMSGPFLQDLAAAGAPRESVDMVMCTHLHVDHVGWNTMRVGDQWLPTFPNARYLFARKEWEYWKDEPQDTGPIVADSVAPIVDAGLADLIEMDHKLTDEVWLEPTPGHTPGHVSVRIRSAGEDAVITGDVIHHPCQIANPDWSSEFDYDKEQSRSTRTDLLRRCADQPVLVIGTHFVAPTAGRIVRDGDTFRLDF